MKETKMYVILVTLLTSLIILVTDVKAATYYVDNASPCSGAACNGTSWATAWKTLEAITGVVGDDTVYISGGTTSKTYSRTSVWSPSGGTSGHPVNYRVGQASLHNGTVIFDGGSIGGLSFLQPSNWVTLDGEVNGSRKITVQNFMQYAVYASGSQGVTIRYITFGYPTGIAFTNGAVYFEVGYCYINNGWGQAIYCGGSDPPVTGWGLNKVHNNTFLLRRYNYDDGSGDDGVQYIQSADIYNNYFLAVPDAGYVPQDHQDGIQTGAGYLRIYNNTFENMANTGIFFSMFGDLTHVRIYNNVIFFSKASLRTSGEGIAIGYSGGTVHVSDTVVANNTVVNYEGSSFRDTRNSGQWFIDTATTKWYNNAVYNGGTTIDPNVDTATNVGLTDANCGSHFVACQTLSGESFVYDFHLKSSDTLFKDKGLSMATYFTTDKDGNTRPQGPAWDIGAYENPALVMVPPQNLRISP